MKEYIIRKKKKRKNKLYKTELTKNSLPRTKHWRDYRGFFERERKMQILIRLRRECSIEATKMCAGCIPKLYKHLPKVGHKYSEGNITVRYAKAIFPKCLH